MLSDIAQTPAVWVLAFFFLFVDLSFFGCSVFAAFLFYFLDLVHTDWTCSTCVCLSSINLSVARRGDCQGSTSQNIIYNTFCLLLGAKMPWLAKNKNKTRGYIFATRNFAKKTKKERCNELKSRQAHYVCTVGERVFLEMRKCGFVDLFSHVPIYIGIFVKKMYYLLCA